ncbi:unnamed protein product [Onchocerca flexuosa]|uniref:Uncharacterized protein n=1 Tax=Onchocerca flexuosa TaxID=387005 RepID=A0A183I7P3_9BILA|nr:unnamed protein product [Onchocerca flexuosa]
MLLTWVIDDVVAGGYMEVDAEQLMRINSKKAKEEAVLRAAAASTQGSIIPKVLPPTSFARSTETSQYDCRNATQGPPHHMQQQQYGTSSYHMQQSLQHQQSQMLQQIPLQQMSLQQQQQQHLLLHQQQTANNMQNITSAVNAGAIHAVSQLPDGRQQVLQAAPSQQQASRLVAQSHLQQQQSINYGSPMMTSTCNAAAVIAPQTVPAASRQLDLNKQMGLSAAPLQESVSSNSYDLYANLPKKSTIGAAQSQHQQQVVFINSSLYLSILYSN